MVWTTIPDSDIDPDSPITTGLMAALRDNPSQDDAPLAAKAGASIKLLLINTASSSATLDFTSNIDSTYTTYMFVLDQIVPATDGASLLVRVSTASAFVTTASYSFVYVGENSSPAAIAGGGNAQTEISVSGNDFGSAASEGGAGIIYLNGPSSTSLCKHIHGRIVNKNSDANLVTSSFSASYDVTGNTVDGVRFYFNTGNIESGSIRMYGIKDA